MADTCIVCLGDLRALETKLSPAEAETLDEASPKLNDDVKLRSIKHEKSPITDDETIAHLLPCKHDLHNACLKPWVERANSCPICRATFNVVELSYAVGGPVFDSYVVKDKVQEAEVDPRLVVEEDFSDYEPLEPCLICGVLDDGYGTIFCDGCDRMIHVFCAGLDDSPEVWYCESCHSDFDNATRGDNTHTGPLRRSQRRAGGNGRGSNRRRGAHNINDSSWARVWQEVSQRLDLDLDFPYDEVESDDQIRENEERQREFQRWQRRFEVAGRQGTANRLRGVAAARLQSDVMTQPKPESQEEIRAWNAFDKARESQEAPPSVRRKRRRAEDSPASPRETETTSQPQLKRPRLRRPAVTTEQQPESSTAAIRRTADEPVTFFSSLLREVESKPNAATSPATSDHINGQFSPRNSSPALSPVSSDHGSPGAMTPPRRPMSPPLSSAILPFSSPPLATFSPFSPATLSLSTDVPGIPYRRARKRRPPRADAAENSGDETTPHLDRAGSPGSTLSYSTKEEIQRMVKLALGARYRDKEITKDQYTDVNRDISRMLYDRVKDASALADQAEREKWQGVANEEVRKAVAALQNAGDGLTTESVESGAV